MDDDRLLAVLKKNFHQDFMTNWESFDYMYYFGSEPNALLYVPLFLQKFVEVDGSVLLDTGIFPADDKDVADSFRKAKANGGNLEEIERSFNWMELLYSFNDPSGGEEEDILLGECVAEAWRARLHYLYHPRKFEVTVETPEQTGDVVHVRFREIR
jgi:hypothetical protein